MCVCYIYYIYENIYIYIRMYVYMYICIYITHMYNKYINI